MSKYVNSYEELVEVEQSRLDILLENTNIDNLFTTVNQKLKTDYLYRYYYNKSLHDVQETSGKILVVPKSGYITQRLVYLNPNLVGGTVVGTQAINITEQDGNIQLRDKGAVNSCSLIQFLRSLFYAFGIKVDESKVDLLALSNAVLDNFEFCYNRETGKSILLTSLDDVEIMYILEDGITYFDEDLVQAFANAMYEAGWFTAKFSYNNIVGEIGDVLPLSIVPASYAQFLQYCELYDKVRYEKRRPISQIAKKIWNEGINARPDYVNDNTIVEISLSTPLTSQNYEAQINFKFYNLTTERTFTFDGLGNKDLTYVYSFTPSPISGWNTTVFYDYSTGKVRHVNTTASTQLYTPLQTINYSEFEKQKFTSSLDGMTNEVLNVFKEEIEILVTDGITIIDDAKIPSNIDSLSTDYPAWYERLNSWIGTGVAKVGEVLRNTLNVIEFVPLTLLPNTPTQAQSGEVTDPDVVGNVPEVVIKDLDPFPNSDEPSDDPYDPNVPDPVPSLPPPIPTPTPPVPPVDPTPSITSGKLFTVYNPTTDDINNLGGFLWGESIAGILAELFSNPMDAIISLNVIYATPSIGERRNIVLGYVKSDDITAPIVTSQYITLDCGTVRVPEYYGNATDYAPFACASIYLPFIGFRDVNINEIMGSEVNINYQIDVYTGTVYASISTIRNGITQVLYTYEGNCAVQIPLTGGDKFRLISGVAGLVAGFAMGSPVTAIASLAGGVVNGAVSNKQGSIGANAGAMGIKKPYIVITNTQAYDAYNYNKQYGFPANASIQLGSCKGYTRVKSVHVSSISNATNEEKQNIDTLLKQGVIIN